jgi:alpha-1,2-mannosyltransferase
MHFSLSSAPVVDRDSRDPTLRVGIIVALAIAAFHILPFVGKFGAHLATGRFLETDFQSFYYAADAAFNRGLSPYSLDVVRVFERDMGGVVYPFLYPPTALPWFLPFALFDFTTAVLLFQAVSIASLFLVIMLLWREIVPRIASPPWQLIFLGALFVFEGVSATLNWAQINLIVVAFILIAWLRSSDPKAERIVAFCLFAASALKTYPLLFLLVPLMRRRFGVIRWFVVFALADLLISLVVLPGGVWRDWLENVVPTGGYGTMPFGLFSLSTVGNQTFNGLFLRVFGEGDAARFCATIAALVCCAATGLAVFLARDIDRQTYYGLSFGLVSVLTFLISPLSWPHHFVFLIPALAAAAVQVGRRHGLGGVVARTVYLGALVICAYPWPLRELGTLSSPWLRSVPLIGPLSLFLLLLALAVAAAPRLALMPRGALATARSS